MIKLDLQRISGIETLPLIEGGKGISISNGETCGAWAAAGGVGTFSAVNADSYDENGNLILQTYRGETRLERQRELIDYAVAGGIAQAKIARERSNGNGRIHMNVLWEMGGCEEILVRILEEANECIHGIVCGAGMPYNLGEIASKFGVYYYPIVSSARAFSALFRRSFKKVQDFLGGVVYEDPWLAGGHNGLSNAENPQNPMNPYLRLVELRKILNSFGLQTIPIIIAGGVWWLSEWEDYINNSELGATAFQFGTRSVLTTECPVAKAWQPKLMSLKRGDVKLTPLSPTGFYSSAVNNQMLSDLLELQNRQVDIVENSPLTVTVFGREVCIDADQKERVASWIENGFSTAMLTPSNTVVFVTPDQSKQILFDQKNCRCCLSACRFSSWCQHKGSTGNIPDPRSFCIQKSLQAVAHGGDLDQNLMFAGHIAYRFGVDPFYANNFIPTTRQLVERIAGGY
ncbi:MAG: nitronate monooxygenase [Holosporaceae bacterium]|jgi:NAD(P)H-dependent flavin oxidoreductase YrpB (nitropropane dioxygenase family)|nr:nitronate monooxygenase [Holosporaceae bacterium]